MNASSFDDTTNVIVKDKKKRFIVRFKNKLPSNKKRLIPLLLIITTLPLTLGVSLVQQELRSRASEGGARQPMIIGMNMIGGNEYTGFAKLQDAVEKVKDQTGEYPAIVPVWRNFDSKTSFPDIETQNYYKENGIGMGIFMNPRSYRMYRFDGRFILSKQTIEESSLSAGQIRFNSVNPANISKIYVSKESSGTEDPKLLASSWISGAKIQIFGTTSKTIFVDKKDKNGKVMEDVNGNPVKVKKITEVVDYGNNNHFDFIINAKIDKGNYWELDVEIKKLGVFNGIFSENKPVFITMPDTLNGKSYSIQAIADGEMDEYFKEFARQAKDYKDPILFRFAHEMNWKGFPWSAQRDETLSYDRRRFFGAKPTSENYIVAWRRVHNIITNIAPNVKFFWCSLDTPNMDYYPGDKFVDYVGFDSYSGIGGKPYRTIQNAFEKPMQKIQDEKIDKPVIIGEIGINSTHTNGVNGNFADYRKDWIIQGYNYAYNTWPNLKAILYYNINMVPRGSEKDNFELEANPSIVNAYKQIVTKPRFKGRFGKGPQKLDPESSISPEPETPIGYLDTASCEVSTGWACDENNYEASLNIQFYADGPAGSGDLIGSVIADKTREEGVARECGGKRDHGFQFSTPSSLKDGQEYKIYAYALDDSGAESRSRLIGAPKTFSCGNLAPGIPTPDPIAKDCIRNKPKVIYIDKNLSGKRLQTLTYKIQITNTDTFKCSDRKIAFDLDFPSNLKNWTYSPEFKLIAPGNTETIKLKVKSGKYASEGPKKLKLSIEGGYKPHTVFSSEELIYNVTK